MNPAINVEALAKWSALHDDEAVVGQSLSGDNCPVANYWRHTGVEVDGVCAQYSNIEVDGEQVTVNHDECIESVIDYIDADARVLTCEQRVITARMLQEIIENVEKYAAIQLQPDPAW